MSTKKSTKQKNGTHNFKHTPKNENAEIQKNDVLVLPPDLLQQLGINLENIQAPQDSSLVKNAGTCSKLKQILKNSEASELHPGVKYIHNEDKDRSILETANLMRASVLLSPTFHLLKPYINLDTESNPETCIDEFVAECADNIPYEDFYNKDELNADDRMKCVGIQINDTKEDTSRDKIQSIKPISKDIDSTVHVLEKGLKNYNFVPQENLKESESKINIQTPEELFQSNKILNKKEAFDKNDMVTETTDVIITMNKETTNNYESTSNIEHQYYIEKNHPGEDIFPKNINQLKENVGEEKCNSNANCFQEECDDNIDETHNASKISNVDNNKEAQVCDNTLNNHSQFENVESSSSLDKELQLKELIVEPKFCKDMNLQANSEIHTSGNGNLYLPGISECKNNIEHTPNIAMSDEGHNSIDSYDKLFNTQQTEYKKYNLDKSQITYESNPDSCNCATKKTCMCHVDNIDTTSSESKVPLGKVKEIAFYLSQICYTGLNRQNSMTKNFNTTGNSKLCIQGVEKPGGTMEKVHLNRNIRTYSRNKNPKFSNVISSLISNSEHKIVNSDIDYKLNDINICSAGTNKHNFCLCGDFGTFINVDNSYEHIHFWKRKDAQCSVETLLSIYEENILKDKYKEDNISFHEIEDIEEAKQLDIPDDSAMGICCWNYTANIRAKGHQELNKLKSLKLQNIKTASNKGKRKRPDKMSESESDCQTPNAKKAAVLVKCGVCNCYILKNEWDNHISEEHCFIAWREDQKIDFKNKDLLVKLNERLHSTDKLICTFCERELYDVSKFIKHVSKCKERKFAGKSTNITEHSEICIEVSTLPVEFEQNYEVPVQHNKSKEQIIKEQRHKKIKFNIEEQIAAPGQSMLQVNIDENQALERQVLQRKKQNPVLKMPVLQVETDVKQVSQGSVLKVEISEKEAPEEYVLQVETGEEHAPEVSVTQVKMGDKNVTCRVCNELVSDSLWVEHISQKHNYIAWKDNEPPLDCEDEDEIRDYLNCIIKVIGELICKECGLKRKFAKSYLKHIKNCQNTEQSDDQVHAKKKSTPVVVKTEKLDSVKTKKVKAEKNKKVDTVYTIEVNTENIKKEKAEEKRKPEIDNRIVTCGVCKLELTNANWIEHILKEHDYLAWQDGHPEIDVNNAQQVYDHLFNISKQNDGLICNKCGLHRKYVKSYLKHIETCEGAVDLENKEEIQCYLYLVSKKYNGLICNKCGLNRKYVKAYLSHLESCNSELLDSAVIVDGPANKDLYECGVCSEKVHPSDWNTHAMKLHYNLAWIVGNFPVDTKNSSVVEKHLKEYKQEVGQLKCNECGTTRVSPMGFYAHIIQCGKSEEEIDKYKIYCELCDSKYLFIYKRQHAVMHKEQEYKEIKLKEQTQENMCMVVPKTEQTEQLSDKRRAAERARQFIEKSETFVYNCSNCGYGTDEQAESDDHICGKINYKEYVDSEDSAVIGSSDDESVESAVDSNLSDEEIRPEHARRKWRGDSSSAAAKVPRIPFSVRYAKSYLKQSADDYRKTFLTNETLYPQWRSCSMELVADDQIDSYLPPLKESCKVIIGRSDPMTYKQFEAKQQKGYSIFVGGCIQCISWAPPHKDDISDDYGHFMAVVCHNDVDLPRLDYEKTYEYSGLVQIWDFGDLSSMKPKFALGIAHNYGTIWAIDWCPSGARDVLSSSASEDESESGSDTFLRLGLLAVACSNGSAYIFSVPYPSSVKASDKNIYKFTPVAELRLSRGKQTVFQATSISWSLQKDHATVVVGYSSGTVAFFNLECNSPLLMETEGEVNILYPFKDERPHSSSITDVKTFPSSVGAGLVSSVSPTGSQAVQQRGAVRLHKHISANSGVFAPHWPALMLSGNEIIVNQSVNELDFWGLGRRTGVVQKCCGCLHCGHMATFVPPVMKILTTHPAYIDFQKAPLAVFQMRPLSDRKRPKQKDDMLEVKLEPLTYHDAVKSYALDFKLMKDLDKHSFKEINRPRMQYPERFPLSDVSSMAFYPSPNHHRKLAVATHAGVIFIITDDNCL
ncbi:jg18491 [Pararge aegeria aegeria]|uniref:Jg18491 protein n=3 Tax=Pararge aegeria TaxID=116150 RepID=A0A8S4RJN5_9NEOP|nr:jg18491 [Pararge aegeria aegeria]